MGWFFGGTGVVLLVLLLTGVSGCRVRTGGKDPGTPVNDRIVGSGIRQEDITDFYYTYDSSAFPPAYQRYRFYAEDGKFWFYHEQREGDHWPLTEGDATVTGTLELTVEEWGAFFDLLKDGKAKKREEHLESGNAGPWLYLYWKGDEDKYQEFSFADTSKELEFEEFCRELKARETGR